MADKDNVAKLEKMGSRPRRQAELEAVQGFQDRDDGEKTWTPRD